MTDKPLIYVILGAPGSGRRELLQDMVQSGLDKEEKILLLVSAREEPLPSESDKAPASNVTWRTWQWAEGRIEANLDGDFSHIFLISDGRLSPVDQIEAFAAWLPSLEAELARIITVVHAQLGSSHKELARWYDACIHFSDAVLINRREDVPQKWINDFLDHYKKEHYPCHFEQVKAGRVKNPALVLEPEPRRISLLFDELPELDANERGDEEDDEEEDEDPYLSRHPSGRREKQVPDIQDYLQ